MIQYIETIHTFLHVPLGKGWEEVFDEQEEGTETFVVFEQGHS